MTNAINHYFVSSADTTSSTCPPSEPPRSPKSFPSMIVSEQEWASLGSMNRKQIGRCTAWILEQDKDSFSSLSRWAHQGKGWHGYFHQPFLARGKTASVCSLVSALWHSWIVIICWSNLQGADVHLESPLTGEAVGKSLGKPRTLGIFPLCKAILLHQSPLFMLWWLKHSWVTALSPATLPTLGAARQTYFT